MRKAIARSLPQMFEITLLIDLLTLIRQFQLIQNADASLTIKYCPEKNANTLALEQLLLTRYKNLLGQTIHIEVKMVDHILPAPNGKSLLVISNYKPHNATAFKISL